MNVFRKKNSYFEHLFQLSQTKGQYGLKYTCFNYMCCEKNPRRTLHGKMFRCICDGCLETLDMIMCDIAIYSKPVCCHNSVEEKLLCQL